MSFFQKVAKGNFFLIVNFFLVTLPRYFSVNFFMFILLRLLSYLQSSRERKFLSLISLLNISLLNYVAMRVKVYSFLVRFY
ncbi:hypothetical protein RhiirA1_121497 [Rhizophagus irregularis]|uniref:Uncharacterized protein n=1 Tax=Rhizophagus irregularis TaxID=588596 RepID=A0A2N0S2A9_9GLOM|nr:hypothetical protein RhiirA1_121497 [Rhizophagus irregularis]